MNEIIKEKTNSILDQFNVEINHEIATLVSFKSAVILIDLEINYNLKLIEINLRSFKESNTFLDLEYTSRYGHITKLVDAKRFFKFVEEVVYNMFKDLDCNISLHIYKHRKLGIYCLRIRLTND